jgi:hypothetical protein
MSELSPLCAQERTWTIRKQSRGGLIPPPASPHNIYDSMAKTHARAAKTKAELREMLTEAVRNTQPEPKRPTKSKKENAASAP